ncbi:MAG: tripartite tricarboxylate transporter substrate binding protein [Burkholderiales bacterium]|nr:tripartite tricarboxylate transporter substrate binding protein [Burkholderiales bacterium]
MIAGLRAGADLSLFTALTLGTACVAAQSPGAYPVRPIRLIVASGAGGGLDFVARLVANPLGDALAQTVVVDNRAGASGSIAAELAAAAAPDGHTLMFLSASLVVYGVANKTRYDLERDFTPVSQVAAAPYILTVHPALPVRTVKDLVAYAKSAPARLNYASTGNASLAHLAGELFAISTGTQLVHIPYKGVGAALNDLLSGQVQMSLLSMGSVYAQVRAQKLKPIAIASAERAKMAPDVPTLIESGVPGYLVTQWHGMLAPRATPRAIVERLQREIAKAVRLPEVAARLALDGTEPVASSPEQFGRHLADERSQWARVAKRANIRTD